MASMHRAVCLEGATPDFQTNCNEVGSQLPHNAHISTVSCLINPGERNYVLEVSVRLQNG